MKVLWSSDAWADVERLYLFLAGHDIDAADAIFDALIAAPEALFDFPRRGSAVPEYKPRDVREYRVGRYLMRYELAGDRIFVLRFFHGRENRAAE